MKPCIVFLKKHIFVKSSLIIDRSFPHWQVLSTVRRQLILLGLKHFIRCSRAWPGQGKYRSLILLIIISCYEGFAGISHNYQLQVRLPLSLSPSLPLSLPLSFSPLSSHHQFKVTRPVDSGHSASRFGSLGQSIWVTRPVDSGLSLSISFLFAPRI